MNRSVNLMTNAALRATVIRRHRRVWLVVMPLLLGLLAVPVGMRWKEVRPLANQRAALEQEYEPIRKTLAENKALSAQIEHLLKDERLSILLSEQRPMSALLGVVSLAASGKGMQVRVENFDLQERNPDETLQTGRRGTLQLRGLAATGEDVSRFVQALRQPPFQTVQLETTEKVKLPSFNLESFCIRCEY